MAVSLMNRQQHVAVIALGDVHPIPQLFRVAVHQAQDGESHQLRIALVAGLAILGKQLDHLGDLGRRKIFFDSVHYILLSRRSHRASPAWLGAV